MYWAKWVDMKKIKAVMINFLPSWWNRHYGIEWGEKMVFDPDYRISMDMEMRRLMEERFPGLPLGEKDPKPAFIHPTFNNALIPAAYGCSLQYSSDKYAQWHYAPSYEAIEKLDSLDIWEMFPYKEIKRQTEYLNRKLEKDEIPFLPPMGVLNGCVQLLGNVFLGDLLAEPEKAGRLMEIVMRHEMKKVALNANLGWRGVWYLFNCSVDMIGPKVYGNHVLEYDAQLAGFTRQQGCGVHLHHCGRFDSYADAYRRLGKLASLEVGFTSDPSLAAIYTGEGPLYVILNHMILTYGTKTQVKEHAGCILEKAKAAGDRLALLALDMDYNTPDDNIYTLFETVV